MAFDIEHFPTSPEAQRMMTFVTRDFYDKSYVGKWLFQVMGLEMDGLRGHMDELMAQIFPETATWGLRYHEEKWGLPVYDGENYEERRRIILAKRDYRAPMMPYRMEQYLQDMTRYTVRIADAHDPGPYNWQAPHPNFFRIYFIGDEESGTLDVRELRKHIDRIKQSHTTYGITEREELIIDESELETVKPNRWTFAMAIPYWHPWVLNGDWLLDGSHTLGEITRWSMGVGMRSAFKIRTKEEAKAGAAVIFSFRNDETVAAGMTQHIGIEETGSVKASAKAAAKISMEEAESIDHLTATTFSRGYWFLDGQVSLDGSKPLNAKYKKEEIA